MRKHFKVNSQTENGQYPVKIMTFNKKANLNHCLISGGSKGGREGRVPPPGPKFLHFHAVFGKNWPNNRLVPPLGVSAPSSGKSWIRHC